MRWVKQGLVFPLPQDGGWMKTHAQVPTPLLGEDFVRVYFASRPRPDLSLTTFVDLRASDPSQILHLNPSPILSVGGPGTFDEHGIMPSCAVRNGKQVFLYYSGWSRSAAVPYTNATGLAISEDGGRTFEKVSAGPILGKGLHDPYSATSPCVLREKGAWHMWYCSGTGWLRVGEKLEHTYDIKHASSDDGVTWKASGRVAIPQASADEALTRPWVIKGSDGHHMWFCYRGSVSFRDGPDAYRIGHAWSRDLERWERQDDGHGLAPSPSGWDSSMAAYPAVLTVGGRTLMFYNGNGFGAGGFGYATLAEQD
jgi:sucrose-6-phosphate hydrolase SacC (GH32 family)